MTDIHATVTGHYTTGTLRQRFLDGLGKMGIDRDSARFEQIENTDEFHTGGGAATDDLLAQLTLEPGMHVIDVGCGVGGPARKIAARHGCRVTGIDLTEEFVELARELSAMVGLEDETRFEVGSALDLPLDDGSADVALLLHVGMNIADKPALMAEVARVLKPGGTFAIYDQMRGANLSPIDYPVPWSSVHSTSHVASRDDYLAAAEAAGFELVAERDRTEFGQQFARAMAEKMRTDGPPPLGPHIMMGPDAPVRMGNMGAAMADGRLGPREMILRKAA